MSAPASSSVPPVRLDSNVLAAVGQRMSIPTYARTGLGGGIVHIGVGGFHRAHLAAFVHDLLQAGATEWSITGSGVMASDATMAKVLHEQNGLYVLIEREGTQATGSIVGSITDYVHAGEDSTELIARLVDPATKIVSLTITESGYPVEHGQFVETEALRRDAAASAKPRTTFGIVLTALEARRRAGLGPFTMLSCDNLPGNGDVARVATLGTASLWSSALSSWLEEHGAFPNAMVDRITPATTDADRDFVRDRYGIVDEWPVSCEPFRQWALEDQFCCGRPRFEHVGVLVTHDVAPYEQMKLRLLNGSHSGLAYHAALAGIALVHDAMAEPSIERFVRRLMSIEVAPNLVRPPGIDLDAYQDSLVRRFSNAAIGDQINRLCMDGSSKFPTFVVPPLEDQLAAGGQVRMLALVLAGWCRYLRGWADDGSALAPAHDPFLADAVRSANESISDPVRFLHYERALGPNLHRSDRLVTEFTAALASLESIGSLATLDLWTS